jgi:hypothetical protein
MMMSKRVALVVCPLPNKVNGFGFHSHSGMVARDSIGSSLGIYCMLCSGLLYSYIMQFSTCYSG